jgi:uncharacterized membrane protein
MATLVIGLVLFLGVHLVPAMPARRNALFGRWGEKRYKGFFSLISLAGFALIIVGYMLADRGPQLFAPVAAAARIAPYAVAVSFILFAAANMRGHLRQTLQHPMLLGLIIWSGVHLLANGDLRGTVLFGAFLAYAVVDLASAIGRHAVKTFIPTVRHDVIAVVAGVTIALIVMAVHRVLFGVRVVAFGL